ncbi:MAG: redoxin domain-containing protein [Gemmatimonadota bacterium]
MALPLPVLVDRTRATYRDYGLVRAVHVLQESATFLVDREGIVRHATRSLNPNASMDWGRLLGDLRSLSGAPDDAPSAR